MNRHTFFTTTLILSLAFVFTFLQGVIVDDSTSLMSSAAVHESVELAELELNEKNNDIEIEIEDIQFDVTDTVIDESKAIVTTNETTNKRPLDESPKEPVQPTEAIKTKDTSATETNNNTNRKEEVIVETIQEPITLPETGTPERIPVVEEIPVVVEPPIVIETPKSNVSSLTSDELLMFNLVNKVRKANNLTALKLDMELTKVARIKSSDIIDNDYFAHVSPTYGDPIEMIKSFGISYTKKAGENLAGNSTVESAHESLMNSAGHKANILDPSYTHIGIGIKKGSIYGTVFTQLFVSRL